MPINNKTFHSKEEHAEYFRKVARKDWFKDHVIRVQNLKNEALHLDYADNAPAMVVVDFYKPGSSAYAVRYIFSGHYVYVSGDLGCATFNCTWIPKPTDKHWNSMWYIFEKCAAREGDQYDFNADVCRSTIRSFMLEKDCRGNHTVFPDCWDRDSKETYYDLMRSTNECMSAYQWAMAVHSVDDEHDISKIDGDYWEWLYGAGDVMPPRTVGIITGLQIISEKLNNK